MRMLSFCLSSLIHVVIVEVSVTLDGTSVMNDSFITQVEEREGNVEIPFYWDINSIINLSTLWTPTIYRLLLRTWVRVEQMIHSLRGTALAETAIVREGNATCSVWQGKCSHSALATGWNLAEKKYLQFRWQIKQDNELSKTDYTSTKNTEYTSTKQKNVKKDVNGIIHVTNKYILIKNEILF